MGKATIILVILLIVSVGLNIYQFTNSGELEQQDKLISWSDAIDLMNSGKVIEINNNKGTASFSLTDGSIIEARVPGLNAILDELAKCGEVCKDVDVSTP